MHCPLCHESIANDSELQLHYLLSCSAYAETMDSRVMPSSASVRFRWVKARRPCIEEEVHLISSLAGSVTLCWNEAEGLFESELTNVPVGQHLCQLAVSGDVLPTEDFVISTESDVIYVILAQDNSATDVLGNPLEDVPLTGVGDSSQDRLEACRVVSPLRDRREELTLDIDSHQPEEHDPHDLSPLHRELLRHQVIHGEPSWVPRSGHESPLLSDEEVGLLNQSSARDPPLLTTEPAHQEDLLRRSPVPLRHGVEVTTGANHGQEEVEELPVGERTGDGVRDQGNGGERRSSSSSSSSSHSAASSTQSSARPSPENSELDAREGSVGSPFLEEQLLPQSRGSPNSPLEDKDAVPKGDKFVVEIVGVKCGVSDCPSPGQVGVEHSSAVSHLTEGDATGETLAGSLQSASRASPLGSVLDDAHISNGFAAAGAGTGPTSGQPTFEEESAATTDGTAQPGLPEHLLRETPSETTLTQPPPGRISPTGSALSDSERLPGGKSPFTSPRVRSLSDINRSTHRTSPSDSLHSEPQFPLPPQQTELLLGRTHTWRNSEGSPYRDARHHSGRSLLDTDQSPEESSHHSERESPAGAFHTESPRSSRTGVLSEGSKHSSRQGTPSIDSEARPSSGERSGGSYHGSSRANPIHGELRGSTESPAAVPNRRDSGEVSLADLRSSAHSSTPTSPRGRTELGSHNAPTSQEIHLDDSRQGLHDRLGDRPGSSHSGSRLSPKTSSSIAVSSSSEVPPGDSRHSLRDSQHGSRPESTYSGFRKSSEDHSLREDINRSRPVEEHVYGSDKSYRTQSPEVSSLLEILRRNEQKEKSHGPVKSSKHQTPRLRSPPEVHRQVEQNGVLQCGPDGTSERESTLSSERSHRHTGRASEAAPSLGAPLIPSRGTAFQVVNGERDLAISSVADLEALKQERDGLEQELKMRTAHFEKELRKIKMKNEDLEQQVLSIQMAASLSQDNDEKHKETERSLDALKSALREREAEIGLLEEREAEIGRLREKEVETRHFQERIEELEKENRLLKEEHESLKTVQQIRMEDVSRVKTDLELELSALRRSLRSSSQRDQEQVTRLKESNTALRERTEILEIENRDLKRQLEKAKTHRTTTDYRISKAKSETDLSAKHYKSDHDVGGIPARSVNFSLGTGSSGFGSSRYAWLDTTDDMQYKRYFGRSSALTNGDSAVRRSTSPYEKAFDSHIVVGTRRRFSSVGDESEISDVSDLDRSWQNDADFRHRTISSESSTSSLFSGANRDLGTNDYLQSTNGYRSPRAYSPADYGHVPVKRRGQRPHSYHGDVSTLTDHYTKSVASTTSCHPRSTTSEYTPRIVNFNPTRETSRLARHVTGRDAKSHASEPFLNNKPFAPTSAQDVRLGSRVLVTRARGKIGRGVVKYVGLLPGRTDTYVGVELEQNEGKHDGSFDGQRFFKCKPNCGIFVSFNKVVMCYG